MHVRLPHLCFFHPCLLGALQAANTWSVYLLKPRLEPSGSGDQQSPRQHFQSHRGLCTVLGMVGGGRKSQQLCRPPRGGFFYLSVLCAPLPPIFIQGQLPHTNYLVFSRTISENISPRARSKGYGGNKMKPQQGSLLVPLSLAHPSPPQFTHMAWHPGTMQLCLVISDVKSITGSLGTQMWR